MGWVDLSKRVGCGLLFAGLFACSDKRSPAESCALASFPVAFSDVARIDPLGFVDPSAGRVLPSEVLRIHLSGSGALLVSPASLKLVRIESVVKDAGLGISEFRASLAPTDASCGDLSFALTWTGTLDEGLATIADSVEAECVTPSMPPGAGERCAKDVEIWLGEGESLGTASTTSFEFAAYDASKDAAFLKASRYPLVFDASPLIAVCPLDAFPEASRTEFVTKIRSVAGVARTADPLCGNFVHDLEARLSGNWFSSDGDLIAFASDPFVDSVPRISHSGMPGLAAGALTFDAESSGFRNRAIREVQADGMYCYDELSTEPDGTDLGIRIVLEMTDAAALKVEKQAGACPGSRASLAFTGAAASVTYAR